jgi:hypothetical protein
MIFRFRFDQIHCKNVRYTMPIINTCDANAKLYRNKDLFPEPHITIWIYYASRTLFPEPSLLASVSHHLRCQLLKSIFSVNFIPHSFSTFIRTLPSISSITPAFHNFSPLIISTTTCPILITINPPANPVHSAGPHHFFSLLQLRHSPAPVKCM